MQPSSSTNNQLKAGEMLDRKFSWENKRRSKRIKLYSSFNTECVIIFIFVYHKKILRSMKPKLLTSLTMNKWIYDLLANKDGQDQSTLSSNGPSKMKI